MIKLMIGAYTLATDPFDKAQDKCQIRRSAAGSGDPAGALMVYCILTTTKASLQSFSS